MTIVFCQRRLQIALQARMSSSSPTTGTCKHYCAGIWETKHLPIVLKSPLVSHHPVHLTVLAAQPIRPLKNNCSVRSDPLGQAGQMVRLLRLMQVLDPNEATFLRK